MPTSRFMPTENIVHRTGASPFSLHQIFLTPDETLALYLHCHPEAEFFLLEEGEILFHVENQSFSLHAGDAIFIPPNLIHYADRISSSAIPCSFHAVVFSTELLEQVFSSHKHYFAPLYHNRLTCICTLSAKHSVNRTLLQCLHTIFSYQSKPFEYYELSVTGLLFICWQELYNHYFSHFHTPARIENTQTCLQQSLDYIHSHYAEPLSLDILSKEAGFSEGYFCHSFKALTGYAPFEYINRVRITKSCELLTESNKKITEIALLCGFNNISYFNRTFYRQTSYKPSEYRRIFGK